MSARTFEHVFITAEHYRTMSPAARHGWNWDRERQRYKKKLDTTPISEDVLVRNNTPGEVALRKNTTEPNWRTIEGRFVTVPCRARQFRLAAGSVQQREVRRAVAWGHLQVVSA